MIFAIFASLLAGATIISSRILNAALAEKIGVLQSTLMNYIVGLTASGLVLLISGEALSLAGFRFEAAHWWIYLGGSVGVITVVLSSILTAKISSFNLTLLIFVGQLFTGILLDYVAEGAVSLGKILGGALVLAGLVYNLNIDRKEAQQAEEA